MQAVAIDKPSELTGPWRFPGGEEAVHGVHRHPRDTRDVVLEGQVPGGRAHFSPLHLRDEDFLQRRQEKLSHHNHGILLALRDPHQVYQSFLQIIPTWMPSEAWKQVPGRGGTIAIATTYLSYLLPCYDWLLL